MSNRYRLFVLLTVALSSIATPSLAQTSKPKLVVAIIVDQFRYDFLLRFRDSYTGGIKRLLEEGAVFADAHYAQYPTVTAIGHSIFLSGATPSVSGIIGNDWFERQPQLTGAEPCLSEFVSKGGRTVKSVTDDFTCLVGPETKTPGASPRRLLVSTIGDELKSTSPASKVVGISIKDRAAILPAGHMADAVYWFHKGQFVSSSYYMQALPDWLPKFNETWGKKFDTYKWLPIDAKLGDKPFCSMNAEDKIGLCGVRLYPFGTRKIESTPLASEMLLALAKKVIEEEKLGTRDGIDLLAISFSTNDLVGHEVGPDAPQIRDLSIRTDRLLGELLSFLAAKGLSDDTLIIFAADHGVAPTPEKSKERKLPGGRIFPEDVTNPIKDALERHFPKSKVEWFSSYQTGFIYLNEDAIAKHKLDAAEVRRVAAKAARSLPHIARVFTRDDLLRGVKNAGMVARSVQLGFYPSRSADIIMVAEPNFLFGYGKKSDPRGHFGTGHLTPYTYDSHVPLIFFQPGAIRSGTYYRRVHVNDVAPTLAAILGIEAPNGSSGRVLSEVLQ